MTYPWLSLEARRDPARQWLTWAVRMKLDLCGCRIALRQWQALTADERASLHDQPAESASQVEVFRRRLEGALHRAGEHEVLEFDEEAAAAHQRILTNQQPPDTVRTLLADWGITLSWESLNRFGRYVLCAVASKRDPGAYRRDLEKLVTSDEFDTLVMRCASGTGNQLTEQRPQARNRLRP